MCSDMVLKPCCDGCGSTSDLYGSSCKHSTLCLSCCKNMAASGGRCQICGAYITKLIRELKRKIGEGAGLNEPVGEDEEEEEEDDDDDEVEDIWHITKIGMPPVLAPKLKNVPKDKPAENTPSKVPPPSGSAHSTPATSETSKSIRKSGSEDAKTSDGLAVKKWTDNSRAKDELPSSSKPKVPTKASSAASKAGSTPSTGPVSEEEIRAFLYSAGRITTRDLVAKFKGRVKSPEDRKAFADILRKISKMVRVNSNSYVVLRESFSSSRPNMAAEPSSAAFKSGSRSTVSVSKVEFGTVILSAGSLSASLAKFKSRIESPEQWGAKDEPSSSSKPNVPTKASSAASKAGSTPSTGPVSEEEIRAVLLSAGRLTTRDLVVKFKGRVNSPEEKNAFADIIRNICKMQKVDGNIHVALRE